MSQAAKPHIYVYSPSSAVRDKPAFKRGVARLEAMGCEVEIDSAALASHTRFAGDDATRLAAIGRAAASGANVALISRGGYGLSRLLPDLPYKALAKAIEKGTEFVGFSDFTALQLALLAKKGATTWAGPSVLDDFGVEQQADDIMQACFEDLLSGQAEGTGWRWPAADFKLSQNTIAPKKGSENRLNTLAPEGFECEKAVLWGGNLCVLTSMVGTPYFPQIKGGILFLEDIAEHPYRVERMLSQLLHAGVLAKQKAIVLGQFTHFKLAPHDKGYGLTSAVAWLRSQLKIPVISGLPMGHVATKVLLPVGAKVTLAVQGRDALILWPHAH